MTAAAQSDAERAPKRGCSAGSRAASGAGYTTSLSLGALSLGYVSLGGSCYAAANVSSHWPVQWHFRL